MSQSSYLKRKRPGTGPTGLTGPDHAILNVIKSKKDQGIWKNTIKQDTKLPDNVVTKSLKLLVSMNLIKEVTSIQNKRMKLYMAFEFEPSKEISGGYWYSNGKLNQERIDSLKRESLIVLQHKNVATAERVHNELKIKRVVTFDVSRQQVEEILNSMVLDNEVIEAKSNGSGDYSSIPVGTTCYRVATGGGRLGAFAKIPCGSCPRTSLCTPDGVISPATCAYYAKWLNIEF